MTKFICLHGIDVMIYLHGVVSNEDMHSHLPRSFHFLQIKRMESSSMFGGEMVLASTVEISTLNITLPKRLELFDGKRRIRLILDF